MHVPHSCPFVNTYFMRCDISLLSEQISMKLATNIHPGALWHIDELMRLCGQKGQGHNEIKMHLSGNGIQVDGSPSETV